MIRRTMRTRAENILHSVNQWLDRASETKVRNRLICVKREFESDRLVRRGRFANSLIGTTGRVDRDLGLFTDKVSASSGAGGGGVLVRSTPTSIPSATVTHTLVGRPPRHSRTGFARLSMSNGWPIRRKLWTTKCRAG